MGAERAERRALRTAEAMTAAEAKAAAETAAMQTHVDAHIAKLIAERIANAATHNTSHSIGTPHVAGDPRAEALARPSRTAHSSAQSSRAAAEIPCDDACAAPCTWVASKRCDGY